MEFKLTLQKVMATNVETQTMIGEALTVARWGGNWNDWKSCFCSIIHFSAT